MSDRWIVRLGRVSAEPWWHSAATESTCGTTRWGRVASAPIDVASGGAAGTPGWPRSRYAPGLRHDWNPRPPQSPVGRLLYGRFKV